MKVLPIKRYYPNKSTISHSAKQFRNNFQALAANDLLNRKLLDSRKLNGKIGFAICGIAMVGTLVLANYLYSSLNKKTRTDTTLPENLYELSLLDILIRQSPKKRINQITLRPYPNLAEKYNSMLETFVAETDNEENNSKLSAFESILHLISKEDRIQYHTSYFEALNNEYYSDIDNICHNFKSNRNSGGSDRKYLALINNGKISSEELENWTHYPHLNCDEYKIIRNMPENIKIRIDNMKKTKEVIGFDIDKVIGMDSYSFRLQFPEDTDLETKIHTIIKFYEILNGPIVENSITREENSKSYSRYNIRENIFRRISLDKSLESVYNVTRYLNYDALKYFHYTSYELIEKFNRQEDTTTLRSEIRRALRNTDIKTPQMKSLVDVMSDKNIMPDIFNNEHAKFRFISRVVLNNNPKADLYAETPKKFEEFKNAMIKKLNNSCTVFQNSFAEMKVPCFYVPLDGIKGRLKIALAKDGKIYTLYEEVWPEIKQNNIIN